jgi:hypothetical protein
MTRPESNVDDPSSLTPDTFEESRAMPKTKPKVTLPPMPFPPAGFIDMWLDPASWFWDAQRRAM